MKVEIISRVLWSYLQSYAVLRHVFTSKWNIYFIFKLDSFLVSVYPSFMPLLPLKRNKYQLFQKDCLNLTGWFPLQAKILKFRACNCLSVLNFKHMLIYRIQICLSNYFIAWVKPDCPTLRPICWEGEGGTRLCLFQKAVSPIVTRWNLFQILSWWYSGIHGRYFCHTILSWAQNGCGSWEQDCKGISWIASC